MKRVNILSLILIVCLLTTVLVSCGGVDFKVNFVVGSDIYASVATNGNETIKLPDNPTKEGYEFEGWYWDNGKWENPFTVNSLLNTPLAADMNVYAKFKHNEHSFVKFKFCELIVIYYHTYSQCATEFDKKTGRPK